MIAAFFLIYFAFVEFNFDIGNLPFLFRNQDFGFWYVTVCLAVGFVVFGGRSIGWLFIRPIASMLHILRPSLDTRKIWIISAAFVWVPLTLLVLFPHQQSVSLLHASLLVGASLWAIAAGMVGGIIAARTSMAELRKKWDEHVAVGGTVTGSLLTTVYALSILEFSPGAVRYLAPVVIFFCLALSLISLVAMLPFALTEPICVLLLRLDFLHGRIHVPYVFVSGVAWFLIGYFVFGGSTSSSTNVFASFFPAIPMGLCGVCGGWAIGQFKADTSVGHKRDERANPLGQTTPSGG